jgi:hypothetical protein
VAAVIYAFSPFTFARTAHIQLLFTGGIPFCLLAFHRLVDRQTIGRAVTLGVLLWLQALACAYYGIFAGLMVGLGTLVVAATRGLWRSGTYWTAIGLAAFVCVALTAPFFLPYLEVQRHRLRPHARRCPDVRGGCGCVAGLVGVDTPVVAAVDSSRSTKCSSRASCRHGLGVTGIVVLAMRQRAERELLLFYGLAAVLAFWLSFGPDAGLYTLFYNTIPIFTFLRAPGRIGILVVLCLAVFAAIAVRTWLRNRSRPVAWAAALAVVAAAELTQAPLTALPRPRPFRRPTARWPSSRPGAVAEFPFFYERRDFPRHAIYMLNSATHWMPLVNGYSDHIPQEFRDQVIPLSSFPTRESFQILGRIGARYVVFT